MDTVQPHCRAQGRTVRAEGRAEARRKENHLVGQGGHHAKGEKKRLEREAERQRKNPTPAGSLSTGEGPNFSQKL